MSDHSKWSSTGSSRRTFIKAGAAGGAVLLAGCSGGDSDSNSNPNGSDGTDNNNNDVDGNAQSTTFTVFDPLTSGATPSKRHLNPWNPTQSGCWHPGANIFDRLAVYSPTKNKAYPLMAESWKMSGDKTLEVTLSDKWTWHNGDQFVAQDWVMQMQIENELQKAANPDSDQLVQKVTAVDDQHIRIKLNDALSEIFAVQNTIGMYNGNLARGVFTKHDDEKWKSWHQKLKNSSGSEKQTVIKEITSAKYPKLENAIGHGPFQIKAVGDNEIVMEKYPDHPNSDNINFQQFSLKLFSTNKPFQPYSSGEVDAAHKGFPVQNDLSKRLPEGHQLFREGRSSNKLFAFNCGHDVSHDTPFKSPNVRKAALHVFDKSQVEPLLQGVNRIFKWAPCRVPGKVLSEGTVDVSNFVEYGQNNTKRAAELLRKEGYEKDNLGNWLDPDGKRFEIKIMNGATRPDIQVFKKNLKDFGIKVVQEQVDDATFDQRRKTGNFDIMPDGSSANGITAMWAPGLVVDWVQSITHFAPEREIPMPVGDPAGSSGTKTINVADHIRKWQSTGEDKYHQELMWWWNQTVPEGEVMYQPDAGAYHGGQWSLDVKPGIKNGVDDALYIAPKMPNGALRHKGN